MVKVSRLALGLVLSASLMLSACSSEESPAPIASDGSAQQLKTPSNRTHDFAQVNRGSKIFQSNCATCHGGVAEGAIDWRQRKSDGKYPAPPLNGTGHAWHHPYKMLAHVIKNGSPGGQGDMPAWREKLSDEEIEDVMAWFISKWPDQVYDAWLRMNAQKG